MPTYTGTPELSIIIPCYQEAAGIARAIETTGQYVSAITDDFEIVAVDDGSSDGTWDELLHLHRRNPRITALRLSRNFGKEYAIVAGLEHAAGRAAIILDADLQHPPELIQRFYSIWKAGDAEVVEGVKNSRVQESIGGRVSARGFNTIFSALTGENFSGNSDFKLLDRKAIDAFKLMRERRCFFRGMAAWIGFRRVQVGFDVGERRSERSNWTWWARLRLAGRAIVSYSAAPLRLIHLLTLLFLVFSLWLGGEALYLKFAGKAVDGFTTVIVLLLTIGGSVLLALGVIAEYIAAIFEEVKGRPRYIVSDRTDS